MIVLKPLCEGKAVVYLDDNPNPQPYDVEEVRLAGVLVGYKIGQYEVAAIGETWPCSCPDYKFRKAKAGEMCKHGLALQELGKQQ